MMVNLTQVLGMLVAHCREKSKGRGKWMRAEDEVWAKER